MRPEPTDALGVPDGGGDALPASMSRLNPQQLACAVSAARHVLVVAGAGSGKTTVLVARIHHYLRTLNCRPSEILALTFTNKAGAELAQRAAQQEDCDLSAAWTTTFHTACGRLLRFYGGLCGFRDEFMVIDARHQRLMAGRLADSCGLKLASRTQPGGGEKGSRSGGVRAAAQLTGMVNLIDALKERGLRSAAAASALHEDSLLAGRLAALHLEAGDFVRFYQEYENALIRERACDFTELILRTVEFMQEHDAFRSRVQERFRAVLVDEFQDTNELQFRLLCLLCGGAAQLFAVGDDDQSIYSFRGAMPHNMLRLQQAFPDVQTYALDINYRSGQDILDVANALIAGNRTRVLDKHLHTDRGRGRPVSIIRCDTDDVEREALVHIIRELLAQGAVPGDIAVLYRNNYLSARIEEALRRAALSYEVIGAPQFLEREEVQNALAYMRAALNHDDDTSFIRIAGVPSRGIGARTLEALAGAARRRGVSLCRMAMELSGRAAGGERLQSGDALLARRFAPLAALLQQGGARLRELPLGVAMQQLLTDSGLLEYYAGRDQREQRAEYLSRSANLRELLVSCHGHDERYDGWSEDERRHSGGRAQSFLSHMALSGSDGGAAQEGTERAERPIRLMTIHAAKGQEFRYVMVSAFEDGILPSRRVQGLADDLRRKEGLEEERRLAYVAVTRAREGLWLLYACRRRSFRGSLEPSGHSPFLSEVHQQFMDCPREERPYLMHGFV